VCVYYYTALLCATRLQGVRGLTCQPASVKDTPKSVHNIGVWRSARPGLGSGVDTRCIAGSLPRQLVAPTALPWSAAPRMPAENGFVGILRVSMPKSRTLNRVRGVAGESARKRRRGSLSASAPVSSLTWRHQGSPPRRPGCLPRMDSLGGVDLADGCSSLGG
jgi:hypothetical protein